VKTTKRSETTLIKCLLLIFDPGGNKSLHAAELTKHDGTEQSKPIVAGLIPDPGKALSQMPMPLTSASQTAPFSLPLVVAFPTLIHSFVATA
jgi:hypothetical protein